MAASSNNMVTQLNCLVVEDNPFTIITLRKALESLGITKVISAPNGQDALDVIDDMKQHTQVILLDLRMPVMGGIEFLSRLSDRKYPGSVILTSMVNNETQLAVGKLAQKCNINLIGNLSNPPYIQELSHLLSNCTE